MHNIVTIYRFKTPFLDIQSQKRKMATVIKKIKKSLDFDWMNFKENIQHIGNYYIISLVFDDKLWKLDFFYLADNISEYYLPIFKLNLYLDYKFLLNNYRKRKTVLFLNNIFECFDGLNEREFLIDIDNNIYYKSGLLWNKHYPNYDFSDIDNIRKTFEQKDGFALIKDFITKFSWKEFELTLQKSKYYYKLHSIFLYFIYLVFLMYQNIENTKRTRLELDKMNIKLIKEWHITLMRKRLWVVENLNITTFNKYKNRLELFFKLF